MTVCSAVARFGPTGYCLHGRHDQCSYAPGGSTARGVWLPECYVTLPPAGGRRGDNPWRSDDYLNGVCAVLPHVGPLSVVRPGHVYRCTCDCHARVGQLDLFEVMA